MNPFIQQMINNKINAMTPEELCKMASQYDISITIQQARIITKIMHEEDIDIMNKKQCEKLLEKISRHVDASVAKKARALLEILR